MVWIFFDLLEPNCWNDKMIEIFLSQLIWNLIFGVNKSTDGSISIFIVNNWQMALVIAWNLLVFPWVMNIHIAHCVYTGMHSCKIWKTASSQVSLCGYDRQAKYCKTDWRGIPIIQISKASKASTMIYDFY